MLNVAPAFVNDPFHLLDEHHNALCGKLKAGEYPTELVRPFDQIKAATLAELCPDCTLVVVNELAATENG